MLERVGKLKIVFVFLILCIILTILKPSFLTATNLINVLRQISIITIIAMGSTMIIISGGMDLSPGSIARVSGVNVDRVKIKVYTYAGLMAGLGGLVLASRIATGHPNSGDGYELDAIAATVIGGTSLSGGLGTIGGTIIGALIIGVLNNGLDLLNVSAYYQQIAKGLLIIAAVLMDQKSKRKA